MYKVKYFIYDSVTMTKNLRPLQAKIKYQCAHNTHNNVSCLTLSLYIYEKILSFSFDSIT